MRSTFTMAAATALLAAGAGRASAQANFTPQLNPDRFVYSADPDSVAMTDSATPLSMGELSIGLALRAGAPPLQICAKAGESDDCTQSGDIVSSRFGADLVAAFGFGRASIYGQLPVVLYQGSDFDAEGTELRVSNFGDLRLGGKLLLVERSGSSLAVDVRGLLPTGGADFTGDGGTTIEPRLVYSFRKDKVGLALSGGYAWRQKASTLANLYVDDELLWSAGLDYQVAPKVTMGLAAFGRVGIIAKPADMAMNIPEQDPGYEERPAELMASSRIWIMPNVALEAAAGTAIIDGYGAPMWRALVGLRFSKERELAKDLDWDRDGYANDVDKCPRDPEDFDKFADEDGCPELDNDQDRIPDTVDDCPNEPEDYDAFEDRNGCPDPDNDKDGILDQTDKCPNDPEDKDAFEDEDGCPDLDNDKDGIVDNVDKCPTDPEDKDGFEDSDGCPEPDNDKDGLIDQNDKCPDQAETYNGIDDADGCPDANSTVVVTPTKIEIRETVYFDLNKATIKPISFKLLDGVAAAMKAHSHLNIRVEGHTDDRADDNYNLKLSQRRAEAVRAYLIKVGIDEKRLEAVGYGESRPAVPGRTATARDQNRRVEFVITNQPGGPTSNLPAAPGQQPSPPVTPTPTPAPGPVTKPN